MFRMKVDEQLNLPDRTLILGAPEIYEFPKVVFCDKEKFNVLGISLGVKPPYVSLEIERTKVSLIGKTITDK